MTDSPTTAILSNLSPVDLDSIRITLAHWTIGYPYASTRTSISDLPGAPGLLLLVASIVVGAYGLITMRGRLGPWFRRQDGRIVAEHPRSFGRGDVTRLT